MWTGLPVSQAAPALRGFYLEPSQHKGAVINGQPRFNHNRQHLFRENLQVPKHLANRAQSHNSAAVLCWNWEEECGLHGRFTFALTFRAFRRHFYPKQVTTSTYVLGTTISCRCWYGKYIHWTKCQALAMSRLTHSPYATKIARIRR